MSKCITVVYLKGSETIDISTEDKLQNASKTLTDKIITKIKPLYTIVLMNLCDISLFEQIFEEDEAYNVINEGVKGYIYDHIYEYIRENEYINIEGFIIFRLKELWDVIDIAERDYIELKEDYLLYTRLLKELTENAPKISDSITIVAEKDNYSVYDENTDLIAYIKNYDDTLLDIILNIAPNKIYIYNYKLFSDEMLLKNIKAIFKEKVVFYK